MDVTSMDAGAIRQDEALPIQSHILDLDLCGWIVSPDPLSSGRFPHLFRSRTMSKDDDYGKGKDDDWGKGKDDDDYDKKGKDDDWGKGKDDDDYGKDKD